MTMLKEPNLLEKIKECTFTYGYCSNDQCLDIEYCLNDYTCLECYTSIDYKDACKDKMINVNWYKLKDLLEKCKTPRKAVKMILTKVLKIQYEEKDIDIYLNGILTNNRNILNKLNRW